ncbi:MAG: cytidylate kinase [Candidatus Improbicoccus devescovinae]|nr:MAG: cytidylate kinase [Candidatus Improbicoccus devescovinae]
MVKILDFTQKPNTAKKFITIAIDGPAGSGKTSVSRALASALNFQYFDTGALYRTIGYYFLTKKINTKNIQNISNILCNINIDFKFKNKFQLMFLDNQEITDKINSESVGLITSELSKIPEIRCFLLNIQRNIAKFNNIIMNGRDIGSVVLPDADIKIFLTASAEVRAFRRFEQNKKTKDINYVQILGNIKKRDFEDINRKDCPLIAPKNSIIFDNSNYNFEESINKLLGIINKKIIFL